MGQHIELLRVVAAKYDAGEAFSLILGHDSKTFYYSNGQVRGNWLEFIKEDTKEVIADIYSFYVEHLQTSSDCCLQYEIEHRGFEDSIGHDAEKLVEIFNRRSTETLVEEFLIAYSVHTSTRFDNYGNKDLDIEYELLGEVDLSKLPLAIISVS